MISDIDSVCPELHRAVLMDGNHAEKETDRHPPLHMPQP